MPNFAYTEFSEVTKNVLTINRKFIRNSSLLANNVLVRQPMRRKEK